MLPKPPFRATVMGLGRFGGGAAAARWLAARGAVVTVTDLADERSLAESRASLAGVPIAAWRLGGHRDEDFRDTDLLVVNPAVRPEDRLVALARAAGVTVTSELELFLRHTPARTIGVTGSNGKSTTAAMIAAIVRADGRRVWLGGNIGRSLLDDLEAMTSADWAVLEISSFQLHHLADDTPLPSIAVVTNCTPNHLNWHGTMRHYIASKQRLIALQSAGAVTVLDDSDPEVSTWARLAAGRVEPPWPAAQLPPLGVTGEHNRQNARLAAAAAAAAGCTPAAIAAGLAGYRGLPDRLELIAVVGGRRFYNDSASTTPESTIAALHALDGRLWLLAGGADKGADLTAMAGALAVYARGAAVFGSVGGRLQALIAAAAQPGMSVAAVAGLADAVAWAWAQSRPGDAIVLSPGCASTDQFVNYRQRATAFAELVRALAAGSDRPGLPEV